MKKRVLCILMMLAMLLCGFGPYEDGAQRVFDQADLLSNLEEQTVQNEIESAIKKISMDMVVLTINDAQGKSAMEYADDFYDQNGFGYGDCYGAGILFLIDMDNREFYLSTAGDALVQFTEQEIETMLDELYYWMSNGKYYDACMVFVDLVKEYGDNWDTTQKGYYDKTTDTFVEYTPEEIQALRRQEAIEKTLSLGSILSKLGISMLIGAVVVLILRIRVNAHRTPNGRVYMKTDGEQIRQRYDHKVNTTVTKRHIPRNNNTGSRSGGGGGGSVHRSSAGRSHGGGGRSF